MTYAILLIFSYLIGSIPFGLLLVKLAGKGDIRKVGTSGGTGATNVARVLGMRGFIATWVLDMAKAVLVFMVARYFVGPDFGALCGAIAVVGHNFPVWLGFKGGKGFAPILGFILALQPIAFAAMGIIWLIVAVSSGYSSFAALVVMAVLPVFGFVTSFWTGIICIGLLGIGLWTHRENIDRLLKGNESKIQMPIGKLVPALVLLGLLFLGLVVIVNVL